MAAARFNFGTENCETDKKHDKRKKTGQNEPRTSLAARARLTEYLAATGKTRVIMEATWARVKMINIKSSSNYISPTSIEKPKMRRNPNLVASQAAGI